jgi:hypothetical protein
MYAQKLFKTSKMNIVAVIVTVMTMMMIYFECAEPTTKQDSRMYITATAVC